MKGITSEQVMAGFVPDPVAIAKRARLMEREARREQIKAERAARGDHSPREPGERKTREPKAPRERRATIQYFAVNLPSYWQTRINILGKAVADNVEQTKAKGGHAKMYFALGGALLKRYGIPPEYIPEIIMQVDLASGATHDEALDQAQRAVRTTILYAEGSPTSGMTRLKANWPWIADVLVRVMKMGIAQAVAFSTEPMPTLEEARTEMLEKSLMCALGEPGPYIIKGPPGIGKTHSACRVAMKLALIPEYTQPGLFFHEGPFRKVVLSFERNDIAIEMIDKLIPPHATVRRFRGSASRMSDADPKKFECVYHELAILLAHGGQSVRAELCDGRRRPGSPPGPGPNACVHNPLKGGSCKAYLSWEDHRPNGHDPRIGASNHAMLSEAQKFAGVKGTVIIDEPPAPLRTETMTLADLDLLGEEEVIASFEPRFVLCVRPIMYALTMWMRKDLSSTIPVSFEQAIREGLDLVDDGIFRTMLTDAVRYAGACENMTMIQVMRELAIAAIDPDRASSAPRVAARVMRSARFDVPKLRGLMRSSSAYSLIQDAASRIGDKKLEAIVRRDETAVREGVYNRTAGPTMRISMVNRSYINVLNHQAPLLLLDAGGELKAPLLKKMLGMTDAQVKERIIVVKARDAGIVERFQWQLPTANRSGWFVNGHIAWGSGILKALKAAIAWASSPNVADASILKAPACVITYKALRMAIELTLAKNDPDLYRVLLDAWLEGGFTMAEADEAVFRLTPILDQWKGEWILGHYGAIRGTNRADKARTYIALGDPWQNFEEVATEAALLEIDAEEYWMALCRAELEQVFGRSRSVCRVELIRMLHVGVVTPAGGLWEKNLVRVFEGEPRPDHCTATNLREMRERAGFTREMLAKKLGITVGTLRNYEDGSRTCPVAVFSETMRITEDFLN